MTPPTITITITEGFKDQWHIDINGKRYTVYEKAKAIAYVEKALSKNYDNMWNK